MADLCDYANRPLAFLLRYVRQRPISHAAILTAVLAAVGLFSRHAIWREECSSTPFRMG